MKLYGIDAQFTLAAESSETLPTWDTKYERSFIFAEDQNAMYYGTNTGWVKLAGTSGTSGSSGTSGIAGTSGTSGTSGTTPTATSGTSGSSGVAGTSGTSGTSSTSGSSGTSPDTALTNSKPVTQAVHQTYAGSASTGIYVADATNINFGILSFSLLWRGSLPDWTPSVNVQLVYKHDGTTGYQLLLNGSGQLQLYLNSTVYTSTSNLSAFSNSTAHEILVSVVRECPSTAGSINFYVDGVLLGSTVSITAGTPATITNTATLYIMGTSAIRAFGDIHTFAAFNRSVTGSYVADLYKNGINYCDKWGDYISEKIAAQNNRDFSSGTIGNWVVYTDGNGVIAYDTGPSSEQCAKVTVGSTVGTYTGGRLSTTYCPVVAYKRYLISADVYIPSGAAWTSIIMTSGSLSSAAYINALNANLTITNAWQRIWREVETYTDVSGYIPAVLGYSTTVGDIFYFDNMSCVEIGATIALEPEGILSDSWQDSSTNGLDASYPASGSSLVRAVISGTSGTSGSSSTSGSSGSSGTTPTATSGTSGTTPTATSGTSGSSGTTPTATSGTSGSSGSSPTATSGSSGSSGTSATGTTSGTSGTTGTVWVSVGTTAPADTNLLWVDTN